MKTEIGEYIVGAYLRLIQNCDFIDYNVRPKEKGLSGLTEIDVVGLRFNDLTAYLCEVTTHLDGLLYVNYETSENKIREKYERQKEYAKNNITLFTNKIFQLWSPIVSPGIVERLEKIEGLQLIINHEYSNCIKQLTDLAGQSTKDFGNPFFRTLQILEHLK
jgi:hypothetical protein